VADSIGQRNVMSTTNLQSSRCGT